MKKLIVVVMFFVAAAGMADDSPLVKAAKANGGPKKKIEKKKVITNADLQKAPNKPATPSPAAAATTPAVPPRGLIADQDKLFHDRAAAQKRSDDAQAKVSDLEKELDRLEQAYYAANDPNYRDKTIAPRFEQTKQQLETARNELADARNALEKLKSN